MLENRSAPNAPVVPVLVYADVGPAIDWLCRAFGFQERLRFTSPSGVVLHAQLVYGEGAIIIGRRGGSFRPPRSGETCQYVHVTVEDVDAHFEHALQAGAKLVEAPADKPFGERQYSVEDPEGHRWTFSQHIADVSPEEWGAVPS